MGPKSELISVREESHGKVLTSSHGRTEPWNLRSLLEVGIVFLLIVIAVWTPPGRAQLFLSVIATVAVIVIALIGRWSAREMGLTRPLSGAPYTLLAGALACGAIALIGQPFRSVGPGYDVSLSRSWQYALWALEQEFILQSIFFIRLENMLGEKWAVMGTAVLFALVHIPSAILTCLSLSGGILFCELFRRWRNIYPLGIIHAALGLTIAASFPDKWLHHMRVGMGYLVFHAR